MDKYELSNFECHCGVCVKCDPKAWDGYRIDVLKIAKLIKIQNKIEETYNAMMNVQHKISLLTAGKETFYLKQNKDLNSIKMTEDEAAWLLGKRFADLKTELVNLRSDFEREWGDL